MLIFIACHPPLKQVHALAQYADESVVVSWGQGGGHTLRTYTELGPYKIGGLCCWENIMNGARQALIEDGQDIIHVGTMAGFESAADAQIEAFCIYLAGPHTGAEEKLVKAGIDLNQLGIVKVWIDSAGHYKRPEVVDFSINRDPIWADDVRSAHWSPVETQKQTRSSMNTHSK
ncbi:hypothetical protein AC578_3206 [Pseudocercospora eumusae]|uniref:CN hydrolase domain-containing protein n=1 Tax=Pseudocercospora eumusae TaxID=321146 RepID=A0A139H5L6_9PEZI|nr:hypothetical protein AC578_3206 [Pseudocercospora eumusae]